MKNLLAALLLFFSAFAYSQPAVDEINNYKYVIVPSKFSFLKEKDQYQLNTFTKMFFEKYGFVVYFDSDLLPPEAAGDNCNKLFADVVTDSNMFITKMYVTLRDCMNNELFHGEVGSSRDKDYKTSYRQALREAFKSFDTLPYQYNGGNGMRSYNPEMANKVSLAAAPAPKKEVVVDKNTLFAQPTENGYQLVDTEPKVIFKLKKTSSDMVFLAEKGEFSGTLIEKGDGKWVFEYYVDGQLKTENVSIKF